MGQLVWAFVNLAYHRRCPTSRRARPFHDVQSICGEVKKVVEALKKTLAVAGGKK